MLHFVSEGGQTLLDGMPTVQVMPATPQQSMTTAMATPRSEALHRDLQKVIESEREWCPIAGHWMAGLQMFSFTDRTIFSIWFLIFCSQQTQKQNHGLPRCIKDVNLLIMVVVVVVVIISFVFSSTMWMLLNCLSFSEWLHSLICRSVDTVVVKTGSDMCSIRTEIHTVYLLTTVLKVMHLYVNFTNQYYISVIRDLKIKKTTNKQRNKQMSILFMNANIDQPFLLWVFFFFSLFCTIKSAFFLVLKLSFHLFAHYYLWLESHR